MWTEPPIRTFATRAVAVACAALLLGGCSGGGAGPSAASRTTIDPQVSAAPGFSGTTVPTGEQVADTTGVTVSPVTSGEKAPGTTGATSPAVTTGARAATNPWFPLEPGYQAIELGTLNRGGTSLEHRRVWTVTNVTKVIDGIRAVLVLDQNIDAGEIAEQAVDYLAVDTDGSVLYLGSYTEAYEGGQFVNAADAWLAGVNGARGTLLPGDPQAGSGSFTQVDVPGQEQSTAKVLKVGESLCVPFDCYTDVLVIQEGDEYKYFASGVGELKIEPHYSGGEQEKLELINVVQLSAQGLAEFSAEAVRLDDHARSTSPGVFGNSEPAGKSS
jgi:hypothetical protein